MTSQAPWLLDRWTGHCGKGPLSGDLAYRVTHPLLRNGYCCVPQLEVGLSGRDQWVLLSPAALPAPPCPSTGVTVDVTASFLSRGLWVSPHSPESQVPTFKCHLLQWQGMQALIFLPCPRSHHAYLFPGRGTRGLSHDLTLGSYPSCGGRAVFCPI